MRNPASYNSILGAIASGASRLNEIANKVGLDTSACSSLLKSLIELNIVEKIYPVTEKESSRKTIYEIKDTNVFVLVQICKTKLFKYTNGFGPYYIWSIR